MKPAEGDDRLGRVLVLLAAGAALGLLLVLLRHASTYFFLFDDFALLGVAAGQPAGSLLAEPIGGFWRPFALLMTRPEALLLGFGAPWANAAVSAALHLLVASLVGLLARELSGSGRAGAIAGVAFGLSPWASESYFWLSSRFEILCGLGYVAALLLGLCAARTGGRAPFLGTLAAFALALGSKEMAVTLPPVLAVLLPWKDPARRRRSAALVVATLLLLAAYLGLRASVLPGLGGAYGSFGELLSRTDLAANLGTWARALGRPAAGLPGPPGERAALLYAAAGAVVLGLAVVCRAAASARLALAFGLTLAPVAWSVLPAGSTASGRYAYLPGVFVALLAGAAAAAALSPSARTPVRAAGALSLGGLLVAGLVLVDRQRLAYREATVLSRRSIEALAPWAGKADRLYVPNLPSAFVEGPYVLKPYSLRFYYGLDRPTIRAEAVTLTLLGGVPRAVSSSPDPLSEHAAGPEETEVLLPSPRP